MRAGLCTFAQGYPCSGSARKQLLALVSETPRDCRIHQHPVQSYDGVTLHECLTSELEMQRFQRKPDTAVSSIQPPSPPKAAQEVPGQRHKTQNARKGSGDGGRALALLQQTRKKDFPLLQSIDQATAVPNLFWCVLFGGLAGSTPQKNCCLHTVEHVRSTPTGHSSYRKPSRFYFQDPFAEVVHPSVGGVFRPAR